MGHGTSSTADEIYEATVDTTDAPPVAIDVIFGLFMTGLHISYLLSFTTFSLAYLEARILLKKEKDNDSGNSASENESIRYFRTIREWTQHNMKDDIQHWTEEEICKRVKGTVWKQLFLLRMALRLGWVISGWMVFIIFIVIAVNLTYGIQYILHSEICVLDIFREHVQRTSSKNMLREFIAH